MVPRYRQPRIQKDNLERSRSPCVCPQVDWPTFMLWEVASKTATALQLSSHHCYFPAQHFQGDHIATKVQKFSAWPAPLGSAGNRVLKGLHRSCLAHWRTFLLCITVV